ncbi:helix-turn-helix transcriptional regulator [Curtobacterium sp. VKM Ac-1376]|uniref:helix-turn-helix transcriptional regulator n=1 Tax=Curtobacterium sp. VKM Ac-1376 TaxID=123312 RepID=UPI00188A6920|nr:helix-turn-helix transcriptional regulator [Curtobacterium sp. VKM Ac-1376]MBF4615700.1 helix-turn-helix domain-containing protein [Curtobacterium sp. VKM Ac-1376]
MNDDDDGANRLGEYLRARRGTLTPDRVGLTAGTNRRVPGLRREEVALLAGISADYYLRLERGRDSNPSMQVLEALARVLQLDEVETAYLMTLGGPRPRAPRRPREEHVPARLHHLLGSIDAPAFIEGRYFDVLAANAAAIAFSPRLRPGNNRLRSLLLDPEEREFHQQWEQSVRAFIALFRHSTADDVDDARAIELVGELSLASARFREEWARQGVKSFSGGPVHVQHPVVGPLELHREKLQVEDLILVVYYADEGGPTAEKLRMLQSLATPPLQP